MISQDSKKTNIDTRILPNDIYNIQTQLLNLANKNHIK